MTSEHNLDEDILQCRAEISQSLNLDSVDEQTTIPEEDHALRDADPLDSIDDSIFDEDPLGEALVDQPSSPTDQENIKKTLVFPRDIEEVKKILNSLKTQKDNLTRTCLDQQQHLADLQKQVEDEGTKYLHAKQKIAELTNELNQHSDMEEKSEKTSQELKAARSSMNQLRSEISTLQQQLEETLRDKNETIESLQKQVQSLETGISRQQSEAQQIISELRESLAQKEEQAGHLESQISEISSSLAKAEDKNRTIEQELQAEKSSTMPVIPDDTISQMPQFDLSDQILSTNRRQISQRRLSPSGPRPVVTENIKKVVDQYITHPAQSDDPKTSVSGRPLEQPQRYTEAHWPDPPSKDFRQSPIADIVRRDIENFCKQHKKIFIEFPSERSP